MHLAEGDNLFSKVFDRAPDKIDSIINYQKSVMDIAAMPKFDFWILGVMLFYIKVKFCDLEFEVHFLHLKLSNSE